MNTHPHRSTTTREKFFHFTNLDKKYFAITCFFRLEPDAGWFFSTSKCVQQDKDVFCRKKGRNIARRRYFQTGVPSFWGEAEPTYESVVKEVLHQEQLT